MPYGTNQIPIKNAGRVMEQFVKIVVPKGTQANSNGGCMAGIGGYVDPKYRSNSANCSSNYGAASNSNSSWGKASWSMNQ